MYTRIYTDQEKWSVNHITYIVVYTLVGYSFVTCCDVRLHIICITYCYNMSHYVTVLRLGVDMGYRMCKTIYEETKMTL